MTRWTDPRLTRFELDPAWSDEEVLAHVQAVREAVLGELDGGDPDPLGGGTSEREDSDVPPPPVWVL
jgi:hypothetical protein